MKKNSGHGNVNSSLHRIRVYKYIKSGRVVASVYYSREVGTVAIDFEPDLAAIKSIRWVKYLKSDALSPTGYEAEVELTIDHGAGHNEVSATAQLIRVLTKEDTNLERWKSERDLRHLPVSPHASFTKEELAWAGKREGTISEGVGYLSSGVFFAGVSLYFIVNGGWFPAVFPSFIGAALLHGAWSHDWVLSRSEDPEQLKQIVARKVELRKLSGAERNAAISAFDERLKRFETWVRLDAESFEFAVSRTLEQLGFKTRVTQSSKDGGVDVEAIDPEGRCTIVQAKRYSNRVGVAVIREMVGIRAIRPEVERVIVFALVGFTSGAEKLAAEARVELMDARTVTLGL